VLARSSPAARAPLRRIAGDSFTLRSQLRRRRIILVIGGKGGRCISIDCSSTAGCGMRARLSSGLYLYRLPATGYLSRM
jgi:hypothetical protein